MKQRIFITGATGLVGFHAVKHLTAGGYEVVAAARSAAKAEPLKALPAVTVATVGIDDKDALAAAMAGCSAVVHCAGAVDPHARREDIFATNVDGTRNTLQAAIAAGVRHFIHISSLSVITGMEDQFNVNESAPFRYSGEAYGDSKIEAEKAVAQEGSARLQPAAAIATTILRPGFIYGPGERAWMPRLINNIRNGKAMLIDGGGRQTNVIYIGNLVKAIELALFNEKAFGQTYNLTDGQTPTKKELFDAISDGLGLPRVQKNIPRAVAQTVCNTVSTVAPFLPPGTRQTLSRFSRAAFRLAGLNQGFDISKAERELGYTSHVPFQEGMAETLKSFGSSSAQAAPSAMAGRN